MKTFKFFVFSFLFFTPLFSQTIDWANRYDYNHFADNPLKIHVDANGNVYVVGVSEATNSLSGYTVIKYSSTGTALWIRNYFPENVTSNYGSFACGVETDASGNVYVSGEMCYGPDVSNYDALTLKYDANGNLLWENRWDAGFNLKDYGRDLVLNSNGDVFISVFVTQQDLTIKAGVVKINPTTGSTVSALSFFPGPNSISCDPRHITKDNQGNVYVIGATEESSGSIFLPSNTDYFTAKINSNNQLVYSNLYNGTGNGFDIPFSIYVNNNNEVIVTGQSRSSNGLEEIATIKYSSSGSMDWLAIYNNTENGINHSDVGYSVKEDNSGNIIVCGYSNLGSPNKATVIKYDQDGNHLWNRLVNTRGMNPSNSGYLSLTMDANSNIYVVGFIGELPAYNYDILVNIYSPSGNQIGGAFYDNEFLTDGILTGGISGRRIALDNSNNIYVIGLSNSSVGGEDFVTIKFNQSQNDNFSKTNEIVNFQISNYPNPFNPNTSISFALPIEQNVKLEVFDMNGKSAGVLVNSDLKAGTYKFDFNASDLASGIYFYKLTAGNFVSTKKMILVK
jgi:hypothetical protein